MISGTEEKRNERIGVESTAKRRVRYGDQGMTGGGLGSRVRGRWEEARVWNIGAADLERESKERKKTRGKFCAFIRGGREGWGCGPAGERNRRPVDARRGCAASTVDFHGR